MIENHCSCNYVANQKGLNESNYRKWVGFYKQYGDSGLLRSKHASYSLNFKLKVLNQLIMT